MKISAFLTAILLAMLVPMALHAQDVDFDSLDTDDDGVVSKEEFKEYAAPKLGGFAKMDEFVDKVDADENGEISSEEFEGRGQILQEMASEAQGNGEEKAEPKMSGEDAAKAKAASAAFESMAEMIADEKWDEASKIMTDKARDDYTFNTIAQGVALSKMQLPAQMEIPVLVKAKEALVEVVEEYKLDRFDLGTAMRVQVQRPGQAPGRDSKDEDDSKDKDKADMSKDKDADDSNDEAGSDLKEDGDKDAEGKDAKKEEKMTPQQKALAKREKVKAELFKALEEDKNRWQIIAAIRKAQEGSPFDRNSLTGEVEKSNVEGEHVYLTIKGNSSGAARVAPPTVVKMKQVKDDWQFDGVDAVRTGQAVQQMMQRLQRRGAPRGQGRFSDDDF